jgi:hypothetical protein
MYVYRRPFDYAARMRMSVVTTVIAGAEAPTTFSESDTIGFSDSAALSSVHVVSVSDTVEFSDSIVVSAVHAVSISDTIEFDDYRNITKSGAVVIPTVHRLTPSVGADYWEVRP